MDRIFQCLENHKLNPPEILIIIRGIVLWDFMLHGDDALLPDYLKDQFTQFLLTHPTITSCGIYPSRHLGFLSRFCRFVDEWNFICDLTAF